MQSGVRAHRYGWTVTFNQTYRGVPVFAGQLRAQVDSAGDLTAVNGFVAPDIKIGVDPQLSAAQAGARLWPRCGPTRPRPATGSRT